MISIKRSFCFASRCCRKQVLMGNTMFMSARFSPNGVQILTCGTDRKIAYWETLDGSLIREVEGSSAGALNCIDVSPDGRYFVVGSNDCNVKIWEYNRADVTHIGMAHAAIVTACRYSPDGKYIVTASADGAVMIWKCPFEAQFGEPPPSSRSRSTCSLREEEWKRLRLRDDDQESIATKLSVRSGHPDTVRTVHTSKTVVDLCGYDPVKPSSSACQCRDAEQKEPVRTKTTHRSTASSGTAPERSDRSKRTSSSNGSAKKQHGVPAIETSIGDSLKNGERTALKFRENPETSSSGSRTPGSSKKNV